MRRRGGASIRAGVTGIHSQADAYYAASWTDHARFFKWGQPVLGNQHLRRYDFGDNSYLTIQSHVPVRTYSSLSDGSVALYVTVVALIGAVTSVVPVVSAVVSTAGVIGIGSYLNRRPYNAVWGGYSVKYYKPGGTVPWGWNRFYGWKETDRVFDEVEVAGVKDPDQYPEFADVLDEFTWHTWVTLKPAPERTEGLAGRADQLVQALAAAGAASGASSTRPIMSDTRSPHLLASSVVV